MSQEGAMSTEPLVLRARDARGVVTLTLNRPQAFNALSEGLLAALQHELDALMQDATSTGAGAGRRRQGVLRRARPARDARAALARVLPAPVRRSAAA